MFGGNTDRHFTHGTGLNCLTKPIALLTDLAAAIPWFDADEIRNNPVQARASITVGQNIYTPADITNTQLIKDDRPYAGWLYMGFGVVANQGSSRYDKIELDIGMIGPQSYAGYVQRTWHRLLDLEKPNGWENQLKNEPGIVLFYEQAQREMGPAVEARLAECATLEARLNCVIGYKFDYFRPNRSLLGALSAHADPQHPLSPFSASTASIRDADLALFEQAVAASKVKLPARIKPYLPRLLWLYQMGLILFWVYDSSPEQHRTRLLFEKTLQMVLLTLRFANLPLLMPMHRLAADLLDGVIGDPGPMEAQS